VVLARGFSISSYLVAQAFIPRYEQSCILLTANRPHGRVMAKIRPTSLYLVS